MIRVPNLTGSSQTEIVDVFSKVDLIPEIHVIDSNLPAGTSTHTRTVAETGRIIAFKTTRH